MKKFIAFLKQKVTFLIVAIVGVTIGGVSTALVSAAIPDNNGQINACYDNITQALRVSNDGTCGVNETAVSWSQNGTQTAYAAFNSDGSALDTSYSKNVDSFKITPPDISGLTSICLHATFTPRFIDSEAFGSIGGYSQGLTGYTSFDGGMVNSTCGAGYNAALTNIDLNFLGGDLSNFRIKLTN